MLTLTTIDIITRIAVAIGLGTALGLERTLAGKTAGMRTYSMITLGSSIFIIISEIVIYSLSNPLIASPLMIPAAIITGIGFIGAGLILYQGNKISGLTSAAGLWVASGIGIASGFGFFTLAIIATIGALLIFTLMWFIENILKRYSYNLTRERNLIHRKLEELKGDDDAE
jgi:putative Mg2+ transporter-C (MgtC) family protein